MPWKPKFHHPPCPNRNAFTRRVVNLLSEFFDYILWLTRTHGPIVRVWVGPVLAVLLADPNYIEVGQFIAHRTLGGLPGRGLRWEICGQRQLHILQVLCNFRTYLPEFTVSQPSSH